MGRNPGPRIPERLFISAPTKNQSTKIKSMKNKFILTAITFAALWAITSSAIAPLGTAFTYQGKLNDGSAPANGIYDLGFVLHDNPTNMSYLGNAIILFAVPITNGLFTVELNQAGEFGPNAFTGQPRWLEIDVRTNTGGLGNNFTVLSPRQLLSATPQAIFANNAANSLSASFATAVADGSISSSKLAPGAVAWDSIVGIPAGFADGIDNDTTYAAGPGLSLSGTNNQFKVNFAGSGSADNAARSDHTHFGAAWTGNSSGFGFVVNNASTTGSGFYSQQGNGSGAATPFGYKTAIWGESSQGDAIYGATGSSSGAGVYGYGAATSGGNYGVYGQSDSPNGVGVLAKGSGTSGTALRISAGAIRVSGAGANTATPAFVHVVTDATLKTNTTFFQYAGSVIDNPYCNNDPNAILIVTPSYGSNLFTFSPLIAVMYDTGDYGMATNRWVILPSDPFNNGLFAGCRYNVLAIKP